MINQYLNTYQINVLSKNMFFLRPDVSGNNDLNNDNYNWDKNI